VLLFNLFGLIEADVRAGDLQSAAAQCDEAEDVAAAIGMPAEYFAPMSVEVHAWAGNEALTREYASILIDFMSAVGSGVAVLQGYHALAVLHLGAGRYREALDATAFVHESSPLGWTSQTLPLAIVAAARSGEREQAQIFRERLAVRAEASGTPWALGLLAQSNALLEDGREAESSFESAIGFLRQTFVPRDLAHARLLYGEWLRRENRQVDAREQLRAAYEFFTSMGANAFAKRAQAELLATGESVRSRRAQERSELTAQERRVARLASQRLTNPEIAAQLFISPATVDYHLRKVFRKLGVASRRQLSDVLR
jgi:DNA-binding CsgD family transcriptional regulator